MSWSHSKVRRIIIPWVKSSGHIFILSNKVTRAFVYQNNSKKITLGHIPIATSWKLVESNTANFTCNDIFSNDISLVVAMTCLHSACNDVGCCHIWIKRCVCLDPSATYSRLARYLKTWKVLMLVAQMNKNDSSNTFTNNVTWHYLALNTLSKCFPCMYLQQFILSACIIKSVEVENDHFNLD